MFYIIFLAEKKVEKKFACEKFDINLQRILKAKDYQHCFII